MWGGSVSKVGLSGQASDNALSSTPSAPGGVLNAADPLDLWLRSAVQSVFATYSALLVVTPGLVLLINDGSEPYR